MEPHLHYLQSRRLLAAASPDSAFCGAHSLAEVYSTLTKAPMRPRIGPAHASLLVGEITQKVTAIALTVEEYSKSIEQAALQAVSGGTIFDYLLAQCALKSGAEVIYTWNL